MAMKRFYCSEVLNKETNKLEYHFKEAKKKKFLTFNSQREAISHVKSLGIDAMVWFRQNGQFVSSIKTLKDVKYEKTDDIQIVKFESKDKPADVPADDIDTTLLEKADNMFLEETDVFNKPATKNVIAESTKETKTKPVIAAEEMTIALEEENYFENDNEKKLFLYWGIGLFLLLVVLIVLIIFAIFLSLT
ncbi:hypothetical protein NV226_02685 [Mycoplasma iguanae]|uniref:Uncharacterized protein n=1 Tax=Mycoplasma iguanae TaxID=292461 RepID=A0ABY5R7W9_9MOLU|nr:hypothetical protein [Mycoplasma iguanae]UVD81606.1 hypothetical protein NV226_02685 [Mycoplasma iguanae]